MNIPPKNASGRVWKKVRRREEELPDEGGDDEMMGGGFTPPVSFRDAVLNSNIAKGTRDDAWEMEDLLLKEEDVRKEIVDGVPTIDFFRQDLWTR